MFLSLTVFALTFATAESGKCPHLCDCSGTVVECHDTNFTDPKILREIAYFMPGVSVIRMTGNNFTELNMNLFGNCSRAKKLRRLVNLRELDLSRNNIHRIHGKSFHCIPNLETLTLDHNNWKPDNVHLRVFTDLISLKNLSLVDAFLESTNGHHHLPRLSKMLNISDPQSEPGLSRLEYLNLASNEFWFLNKTTIEAFCRFKRLKLLDLSDNNLGKADINGCTRKLEVLNLSKNRFVYMSPRLISVLDKLPNLKRVYLGDNDYACDCHTKAFQKWLNKTSINIVDRARIRCKLGYFTTYQGKRLDRLPVIPCTYRSHSTGTHIVLAVMLGGIVCFTVFVALYNRNKVKTACSKFHRRITTKSYLSLRDNSDYSSVSAVASF